MHLLHFDIVELLCKFRHHLELSRWIFVNKPILKIWANALELLRWALRGRGCGGFRAYHPNTGQLSTIGRPMVNRARQPLIDVGDEGTLWNQWRSGDEGSDSLDQSASQWCLLVMLEEPHGDAALTQQLSRGCRHRVSDNLLCQISHKDFPHSSCLYVALSLPKHNMQSKLGMGYALSWTSSQKTLVYPCISTMPG